MRKQLSKKKEVEKEQEMHENIEFVSTKFE